jgi:hypothetical protein
MVAENEVAQSKPSDQEVQWARDAYSSALRELTANLLRVVAGAGKPHRVLEDAANFVHAFVDYHPHMSFHERVDGASKILSVREEHRGFDDWKIYDAEEDIIVGALRIAASRLLGQRTQEAAGKTIMDDGFRWREEARAERRRANNPGGYNLGRSGAKVMRDD